MKNLITALILFMASALAATAAGPTKTAALTKADSLRREMTAKAREFAATKDRAARKQMLKNLDDLDWQIKLDRMHRIWEDLDTATATARDYRRIGVTMLALGQGKHARWCFYKGGALGDPCCVNYMLVDLLKTEQDPAAALFVLQNYTDNGMTPPLMHNLALALSVIETDDPADQQTCRDMARTLGNAYFELMNDPVYTYGPYDNSEYIDYNGSLSLLLLNRCWRDPYDSNSVGLALRNFLDQ